MTTIFLYFSFILHFLFVAEFPFFSLLFILLPQPFSNECNQFLLWCFHVKWVIVCNWSKIRHMSTHGNHCYRSILIQWFNYSINMPRIKISVCEINICQMSIEWSVHDVRSSDALFDSCTIESVDNMKKYFLTCLKFKISFVLRVKLEMQ